jgi:hypothetical protein
MENVTNATHGQFYGKIKKRCPCASLIKNCAGTDTRVSCLDLGTS